MLGNSDHEVVFLITTILNLTAPNPEEYIVYLGEKGAEVGSLRKEVFDG